MLHKFCAMLPSSVAEMTCGRNSGADVIILPPYSPIRAGVTIPAATPASTVLMACAEVSLTNGDMRICHFLLSNSQFKGIKIKQIKR